MKLPEASYPHQYVQEVAREGKYFENIRLIAEYEDAKPGEEFELELTLVPDQLSHTVYVQHARHKLGELPDEDAQEWWPILTAIKAKEYANLDTAVDARIWTCPDWEGRFYASVRLEMPTVNEALEFAIEDVLDFTAADIRNLPLIPKREDFSLTPTVEREINVYRASSTPKIGSARKGLGKKRAIKAKPIVWILWALTGIIGGHRYYLRNYRYAFLMTVTLGGGGLWWLVDAFFINRRVDQLNHYG